MSEDREVSATMGGGAPSLSRAESCDDGGFTLVEVMVVVLILGILLTIATPTLHGARARVWDVAARSSVRTSMSTSILLSEFRSDFTFASPPALAAAEPSLTYVDGDEASTGPHVVSVDASSPSRWVAVARSNSGSCFGVVVGVGGQTFVESDECAAADITTDAPGPSTFYSGAKVHEGTVGAITENMCLEVVSGFVRQMPCTGEQPAIRIHTRSDGYSTVSTIDGNCFGTAGTANGAAVIDEPCTESIDQLWTVIPAVGGRVQFKNAETGWCMDVAGNSSAAGARITQWGYGSPPNGTCKSAASANNHSFSLG